MVNRRRSPGMALATAIMVAMILLILGLAFLAFLERDYRFAGQQARNQEAYYLALAGLQFQRSRPDLCQPGASVQKFLPTTDPTHYFILTVAADGAVTSKGVVMSGLISTVRELTVPVGRSSREYHDETLR